MAYDHYKPVLEVTRGPIVESVHFGAIAIVASDGRLVASYGDPDTVTYLRSSAKPFQALPFVELGGPDAFGLNEEEVAILCASHDGTDEHVRVVSEIQKKIGVNESNLLCGTHYPFHDPTKDSMIQRGEKPTPNRHNCSGKHTGMLAQALLRGVSIENYIDFNHPVQKLDLQVFAEMCDIPVKQIALGVDGCSAPVFAVPMRKAAYAYARLVDPRGLSEQRAAACQSIMRAMTSHSFMIAGPDRLDTVLMQVAGGKIVSKGGAEGYLGFGLLPGVLRPDLPGVGITYKISDGDAGGRARSILGVALLKQLGVLNAEQLQALAAFDNPPVLNWRKLVVGEIRPAFQLEWHI